MNIMCSGGGSDGGGDEDRGLGIKGTSDKVIKALCLWSVGLAEGWHGKMGHGLA